jgi:hypothetical protein
MVVRITGKNRARLERKDSGRSGRRPAGERCLAKSDYCCEIPLSPERLFFYSMGL